MTQEQLVQLVNQKYTDFRSTFEKPMNLVSLDEVSDAYTDLLNTSKEIRILVSDEIAFWFQYRNDNSAHSDWSKTQEAIHATLTEAFEIYENKDWSVYER